MASTASVQFFTLDNLAPARGTFGPLHSHATKDQMHAGAVILGDARAYGKVQHNNCIICMDDRLGPDGSRLSAARLAGGGLVVALMYHMLHGGTTLSAAVRDLREAGFYVVFHNDCGALKLASTLVPERLGNVDAEGYALLRGLGIATPLSSRRRIATWARSLPRNFVDAEAAMTLANQVEKVVGEHNAVAAAINTVGGQTFAAAPQFAEATNGLLTFVIDLWAVVDLGHWLGGTTEDKAAATLLAQIFTAEVLLQLSGPDLELAVRK